MSKQKRMRGFTLIEMLITIVVYGLIMLASTSLFRLIYVDNSTNPLALNAVDQAENVATTFTNEVRDAATGNDGSYPLNQASSTQIIFFSPYDSLSSTTVYRIRYYVASSTLYKGVIIPSGSPATYNTNTETIKAVLSGLSLGTTSLFSYYTGTYGGTTTPLAQPVNINQVTYVSINLIALLQEVQNATNTFSVTTGATIRNLKTNLGN
jgi:prepilin-type N-terminal cleavage/methylation domain-containing protein